jgi:hypothetical protein
MKDPPRNYSDCNEWIIYNKDIRLIQYADLVTKPLYHLTSRWLPENSPLAKYVVGRRYQATSKVQHYWMAMRGLNLLDIESVAQLAVPRGPQFQEGRETCFTTW